MFTMASKCYLLLKYLQKEVSIIKVYSKISIIFIVSKITNQEKKFKITNCDEMIKLLDTKKGKEGNNIYNSVPGHLKSQSFQNTPVTFTTTILESSHLLFLWLLFI